MSQDSGGREYEIIEYEGSILRVEKINGLYKCPYCGSLFYTPRDLFQHLLAHAKGTLNAQREPSSRWR